MRDLLRTAGLAVTDLEAWKALLDRCGLPYDVREVCSDFDPAFDYVCGAFGERVVLDAMWQARSRRASRSTSRESSARQDRRWHARSARPAGSRPAQIVILDGDIEAAAIAVNSAMGDTGRPAGFGGVVSGAASARRLKTCVAPAERHSQSN